MPHPDRSTRSFLPPRIGAVTIAMALMGSSGALAAQTVPNREDAVEVRKQFMSDLDTLQGKFVALAEAFPADKYAWRPAPGVRSAARSPSSARPAVKSRYGFSSSVG